MNTTKIKALICDNSVPTGTALASALTEHGIFAYTRSNTESTIINSIVSEAPDVVISYLTLGDSDVVTLMHKVRDTITDAPAFIVISEIKNTFIERQIMSNGAAYFIAEPINTDELAEAVAAVSRSTFPPNIADPEILVTEMIKKMCIPANLKGYRYIRSGVLECLRDRTLLDSITKRLYPTIAERFATTPARVERAIRTAIENSWERADKSSIRSVLGYDNSFFSDRPTNSEFIAMLSDKILLQMKSPNIIRPYISVGEQITVTANAAERAIL